MAARPDPSDMPSRPPTSAPGNTANRMLFHGARYHDRSAVFLEPTPGANGASPWTEVPDWRADRHSIRAGLVLRHRFGLPRGTRVAVWGRLDPRFAVVERGAWMLQIATVPVDPSADRGLVSAILEETEPSVLFAPAAADVEELREAGAWTDSLQAAVIGRGGSDASAGLLSYEDLQYYGGVLDTPERAVMCRSAARDVPPEAIASLEIADGGGRVVAVTQRQWAEQMEAAASRAGSVGDGPRPLPSDRPTPALRALAYAGWADGETTTAFAPAPSRDGADVVPDGTPELPESLATPDSTFAGSDR